MPDKVRSTVLFIAHSRHSLQLHKVFDWKAENKTNKINVNNICC